MKKSKFSEDQIIGILRETEGDTVVPVVWHAITSA